VRYLNLLVLRSPDIERTRRFYEVFGLRFTRHAHGSGPEHYAHEDERGVFEIYPAKQAAAAGGDHTGLGFVVDDLEAVHRELGEYAPAPIAQQEWGQTFVVRDPDGRRVEVKQA
jgi:catechol 2,3-dioxygenase-like lactoylglutathione lyase family enzyme